MTMSDIPVKDSSAFYIDQTTAQVINNDPVRLESGDFDSSASLLL